MVGPDFIIIGAMKCATSTLQTQLSLQPGFFMTNPKEPNYFSDDDVYAKGAQWYEDLFAGANQGDLKGEASTHYTKLPTYPNTLERLKAHCKPDTRFIYMMRDPMDRLVSHYIHEWSQGVISSDIDQALKSNPELIAYSKYYMQLEPYLTEFGSDQVLPVFYERFIKWPDQELKRVTEFLGYEQEPKWVESEARQNVSSERIREFPGYGFLVNSPFMTALRRNLIPQSVRDAVKGRLTMNSRPELSESARKWVTEEIDQDLKKLGDYVGFELNCAQFAEQVLQAEL